MIFAAVMALMLPAIADVPKDRVSIAVRMQVTNTDGRDGGSVWGMVPSPLQVGKQTTIHLSRAPGYCGGGISFGGAFDPGTSTAWRIHITPLKVGDMDTVTFRLAWARVIVDGRPSNAGEEAVELTLQPGQSVPIDLQPWAAHAKRSCGTNQAVITVAVEPPIREMDRQLVVTDLWLIDKVSTGAEQTQRLTLRGRFGEVQRFYFDDIHGADRSLDLSGELLVLAREDGVDLQLKTQRRRVSYDGKARDTASATSRVHLGPSDTAAVELPKASQEPFEGHELSLRIQSREIRPERGRQSTSVFTPPGRVP
jgi:hypothetical protein